VQNFTGINSAEFSDISSAEFYRYQ